MKITLLAITALFAATTFTPASVYAQDSQGIMPGQDMPMVRPMRNATTGGEADFKTAAGKNGLLVMFSCNTCPFVVRNQETTKRTMEYAAQNGVGMIIINSNEAKRSEDDSYDAMKTYAKKSGYNVPYVIDADSKLADAFGATHTPEIYLFNNKGKLVYKGAMNDNPGDPKSAKKMYIEDAISAMTAGKTIDPQVTKSVGCSIKRKA